MSDTSDVPISALPNAILPLSGTEDIPLVQNGTTVRVPSGAIGGYLGVPQNLQNNDYQFALTDNGKHVYHTVAGANTYTIPLNATTAFLTGTAITVTLGGASGNVTVAVAGGVTLRQAGTTNTGNRTLAANAMATLLKVATDEWVINGVGIS